MASNFERWDAVPPEAITHAVQAARAIVAEVERTEQAIATAEGRSA
jgi:hypothetical protein